MGDWSISRLVWRPAGQCPETLLRPVLVFFLNSLFAANDDAYDSGEWIGGWGGDGVGSSSGCARADSDAARSPRQGYRLARERREHLLLQRGVIRTR